CGVPRAPGGATAGCASAARYRILGPFLRAGRRSSMGSSPGLQSNRLARLRRALGGLDHRDRGAAIRAGHRRFAAFDDRVDEVLELICEALHAVDRERVGEVLEGRRLPFGDPAFAVAPVDPDVAVRVEVDDALRARDQVAAEL